MFTQINCLQPKPQIAAQWVNDAVQSPRKVPQKNQKGTTLHKEKSEVYSDHTEGVFEFQPQNFHKLLDFLPQKFQALRKGK